MFTIIKTPQGTDSRRPVGKPRPEIISHREDEPETEKWSQKMRHEETTYRNLKKHRDSLLESEIVYKKTIKDLEKERADLVNIYEPTYKENKILKSIIEHGPEAIKVKKLHKAKREMQEEVEKLKDENKRLTEDMNEIVKVNTTAKDILLEKQWQETISNTKKNKDKKEMKVIQGPFSTDEGKPSNKSRDLPENERTHEQDMYDLELDNVEKEIQVILNNVKHLKKQKEIVDHAVAIGKGAVVKNHPIENALSEKFDRDLNTFRRNIKSAKKKQNVLKQKLEKERDIKILEKETKNVQEILKVQEQNEVADKSFNTSETQTDFSLEVKRSHSDIASSQLHLKKGTSVKPHKNRAVQTDFEHPEDSKKLSTEQIQFLDQYEKNKIKLQEMKDKHSKKAQSKTTATEYAKKLVVRRNRNEMPYNKKEVSRHDAQQEKQAMFQDGVTTDTPTINKVKMKNKKVQTDIDNRQNARLRSVTRGNISTELEENETRNGVEATRRGRFDKRTKQNKTDVSTNQSRMSTNINMPVEAKHAEDTETDSLSKHRRQDRRSIHTNYTDSTLKHSRLSRKAAYSVQSKNHHSKEIEEAGFPNKSVRDRKERYSNYRDMLTDRSYFLQKSENTNINFRSTKPKSKSVDDLNKERSFDYWNKIITPGVDTPRQNTNIHGNQPFQATRKYRNIITNSSVEKSSKLAPGKGKVATSLPSKHRLPSSNPYIEDTQLWKSESDLRALVEEEENRSRHAKEFKYRFRRKDVHVHFYEQVSSDIEKGHDDSAYDEVLVDLQRQYDFKKGVVYQDFKRTVQNYRSYKENARESQKANDSSSGNLPSIVPHPPVHFNTDARKVTNRELQHLMEK